MAWETTQQLQQVGHSDMANPLEVPPYVLQSLIPSITAGSVTCAQAFGAWTHGLCHVYH